MFFLFFSWIKNLKNGKFDEKYSLKKTKFRGKLLKYVDDSDMEEEIDENLSEMGINQRQDRHEMGLETKNFVETKYFTFFRHSNF